MSDITMDEMLAAITKACVVERVLPPSDEGMTIRELAKEWGCSEHKARKMVFAAAEAGKLVEGKRHIMDKAKRIVWVAVYRAAP